MKTKQNYYDKIELLIRSICHDPKCKTITICPNKCTCKRKRKFKLNRETSMCWLISEFIASNPMRNNLTDYLYVFCRLSEYHMTKEWEYLFAYIYDYVSILKYESLIDNKESLNFYLDKIKNTIPQLKREKK